MNLTVKKTESKILTSIERELYKLLQRDTDQLDLPGIIKKGLKALKAIVTLVYAIQNYCQN